LLDGITYQQESYASVIREALPLLQRHHEEIGGWKERIPFDPNFDYYFAQELLGNVVLVTVRSHGVLVGYCMQITGPGIHYKQTQWSVNDLIWLDPAFRSGRIGIELILKMEEALRARKVQMFEMLPRHEHPALGRVLDYLKFRNVGSIRQKWLGD
jgi:hypothetical protein